MIILRQQPRETNSSKRTRAFVITPVTKTRHTEHAQIGLYGTPIGLILILRSPQLQFESQ